MSSAVEGTKVRGTICGKAGAQSRGTSSKSALSEHFLCATRTELGKKGLVHAPLEHAAVSDGWVNVKPWDTVTEAFARRRNEMKITQDV